MTTAVLSADAFAAQFKESFRSLWVIANIVVRDAAAAEDVVQEAAVVALRKLHQFKPRSSFVAWMGQIVRYTALNRARTLKRRDTHNVEPVQLEQTRSAPPAKRLELTDSGQLPAYQEHFDDQVKQVLDELSHDARSCLLLRTVQGLDYAAIAELLEIPEGTAMSHVHRARKLLRARLTQPSREAQG